MRLRILSIALTILMLITLLPTAAMAATVEEINEQTVFLKEKGHGTCTLASTAMMLRRAALLNGDPNWRSITEASCRKTFWRAGRGLPYNFSYGDYTVSHGRLPGGEANREYLANLLAEHPEGIVLHAPCVPHGVLLTDYTDGGFYCADPAVDVPLGRVSIYEAHGTRIENSSAYWYVTSSVEKPEPNIGINSVKVHTDSAVSLLTGSELSPQTGYYPGPVAQYYR